MIFVTHIGILISIIPDDIEIKYCVVLLVLVLMLMLVYLACFCMRCCLPKTPLVSTESAPVIWERFGERLEKLRDLTDEIIWVWRG